MKVAFNCLLVVALQLLVLSASQAQAATVKNVNSKDVQVLQMWISKNIVPEAWYGNYGIGRLEFANCERLSSNGDPTSPVWSVDCSATIEELARIPDHERVSPLIVPATYSIYSVSGDRFDAFQGACSIVDVVTVTRESVFDSPSFRGIGFYVSSLAEPVLVSPLSLDLVGKSVLADGETALVHRFLVWGFCSGQGGNSGTLMHQFIELKPFVQYETSPADNGNDPTIKRAWEDVSFNHRITRYVTSFDRQRELLREHN